MPSLQMAGVDASAQQTSEALADLQADFAYQAMLACDRPALARRFDDAASALLAATPSGDVDYVRYRLAAIRAALPLDADAATPAT